MATNLSTFPYVMQPISNITPFTYPDGISYLEKLEKMRVWLNETLVPNTNESITGIIDDFQTGITNAEQTITSLSAGWDSKWTTFMANLSAEIAALNNQGIADAVNVADGPSRTAILALINDRLATEIATVNAEIADLSATVDNVNTDLATTNANVAKKIDSTSKGVANGVASLDGNGKLTGSQLPVFNSYGSYLNRPGAANLPDGYTYRASDSLETYMVKAGEWITVSRGGFYGSAKLSTDWQTNSTSLVDVPGLAVTFIAGTGPVKITVSGEAKQSVTNGQVIMVIALNGADIGHISAPLGAALKGEAFTTVVTAENLIPGNSYTAKLQAMVGYELGGYGTIAGTDTHAFLIAEGM